MSDKNDFSELLHNLTQSQQTFSPLAIDVIGHSIICPCCREAVDELEFHHRYTRYVNEELNWLVACAECQRADEAYLTDLWADYWSAVR